MTSFVALSGRFMDFTGTLPDLGEVPGRGMHSAKLTATAAMFCSTFCSHELRLLLVALLGAACGGETRMDDDPMGSGGSGAHDGETDGPSASGGTGSSTSSGGSDGSRAGSSSGSTSGAGGSYLTEDYCFDPDEVEVCPREGWYGEEPFVFYDAATLDPDAKFLGLDGNSALLEIPGDDDSKTYRVVTAQETFKDDHVRIDEVVWPEAVGGFEVRHAWSMRGSSDYPDLGLGTVNALGCDDVMCRVFTSQDGEGNLDPVPNAELPLGMRGLSFDNYGVPCAFGEGAYCWDGAGFAPVLEVPPGAGERFTEFFMKSEYEGQARRGIAVTDAGAVLLTDKAGTFQMVVPPASTWGLVADVEHTGWEFSVLFESGAWWLGEFGASTELPTDIDCFNPDEMEFLSSGMSSSMLAVDGAGFRYVRHWFYLDEPEPEYRFCASQRAPVPDLLKVSATSCGLSTNLLGVTEQQFFGLTGPIQCPVG